MASGMGAAESQAREGLKLFAAAQDAPLDLDTEAAELYKAETEARLAALEVEAAGLNGKEHKKERAAKGKEIAELKGEPKFVDACKVARGHLPVHGFFVKRPAAEKLVPDAKREPKPPSKDAAPAVAAVEAKKEKEAKKPKKEESAGLSPAETRELEQLKSDILERKAQLKAEGLSGGQQNKDQQVTDWVTRMNELKEKAEPGSTQKDAKKKDAKKSRAPLSAEEQKELDGLKGDIEAYKHKLKAEFGYSNKDIKADPELLEMEERLAALEKREG